MSIPANEIAGVDPEARSANLQEGYISELEKRVAGKLAETESKLEIVSFVDRMEAEYHELDAKLNKAVDFVKTETHAALHPDYQHLVQQQISGMSQYLHALAARLLHHGRGVTLGDVAAHAAGLPVPEGVAVDPAAPGADKTVAVTMEAGVVTNVGELATTSGSTSAPDGSAGSAASAENHASS